MKQCYIRCSHSTVKLVKIKMARFLLLTCVLSACIVLFVNCELESHPLDPLSPTEVRECSGLIRRSQATTNGWNFIWITLVEPEKSTFFPLLRKPDQWTRVPRKCLVVVIERTVGRVFEGIVNLNLRRVEKWEKMPTGTQPLYAPEELIAAERIFRNDSNVRERCRRLGYVNMESVAGEPWAIGYIEDRAEWRGRRLLQVFPYGLISPNDNPFAHPFDFTGIVDVVQERVIAIENMPVHHQFSVRNNNFGVTIPQTQVNYDTLMLRGNTTQRRVETKPIARSRSQPPVYSTNHLHNPVTFAHSPAFRKPFLRYKRDPSPQTQIFLTENELRWENFQMRIGFNAREGMVIHDVRFKDGATWRPLIYRMSMVEMLVPYADPRPPYHRKAVYDAGEYGMGFWANPLQAGVDCAESAVFISGIVNNLAGESVPRPNAICVYEEEMGLLFKHTHLRNRRVTYARNRRLVVSSISTVGNYDYAFYWVFGLDGSIQFTAKATGLLDTELLAKGEDTYGYGIQIFPQLNTQHHQHHFAVRLDPMLDGPLNSVAVVDVETDRAETGSPKNPYGQAFSTKERMLETVSDGCTRIEPLKSRTWQIYNEDVRHPNVKENVGWRFIPVNSAPILMRRDSPLFPKAGFTNYDVWVTPYNDKEIYPGGFYLNGRGLPDIVKRNPHASIQNKDIVLWHIFGITHIPRAEDFPIMPMEETGFIFRPHNFFLQNPSLAYGISLPPFTESITG